MREVKAEEGVASVEHRQEDGGVSLCAGVRLHVDPFGAEELLQPLNGQRFALVHHLATAIVALAGVSFGILVRQAAAHSLHDLVADEILRGDQLNTFQLTLMFAFDNLEDCFVSFHLEILFYDYVLRDLNSDY